MMRKAMMSTPAKALAAKDVRRLLEHVSRRQNASRQQAMVLLSFKAGLRAAEIAGLDWTMVLDATGRVSRSLLISGRIAKYGRARRVPLHRDLRAVLDRLHVESGRPRIGVIIRSLRGGSLRARSVVNWFANIYSELGYDGCSSHSGRRTFITQAARLVAKAGGSLRDVQELAGHRAITTTERYIEGDRDAQRKLVHML
jgi:integrase/recombinase XerD